MLAGWLNSTEMAGLVGWAEGDLVGRLMVVVSEGTWWKEKNKKIKRESGKCPFIGKAS